MNEYLCILSKIVFRECYEYIVGFDCVGVDLILVLCFDVLSLFKFYFWFVFILYGVDINRSIILRLFLFDFCDVEIDWVWLVGKLLGLNVLVVYFRLSDLNVSFWMNIVLWFFLKNKGIGLVFVLFVGIFEVIVEVEFSVMILCFNFIVLGGNWMSNGNYLVIVF